MLYSSLFFSPEFGALLGRIDFFEENCRLRGELLAIEMLRGTKVRPQSSPRTESVGGSSCDFRFIAKFSSLRGRFSTLLASIVSSLSPAKRRKNKKFKKFNCSARFSSPPWTLERS
jgi:hypothetical protein